MAADARTADLASARVNPLAHVRISPVQAVALIAAASAIGRTFAGWLRASPIYFPDEYIYSEVARSIADHGRPLVRGARSLITRWYVAGYRAARPLDMEQVRYFEVVRLLQFLCEAGEHIEAIAAGATPPFDSPFVPPEVRGGVIRRLRALTDVPVSLPDARSAPKR